MCSLSYGFVGLGVCAVIDLSAVRAAERFDPPGRFLTRGTHLHAYRAIDREVFLNEAGKLRASFDKYKDLPAESGCV